MFVIWSGNVGVYLVTPDELLNEISTRKIKYITHLIDSKITSQSAAFVNSGRIVGDKGLLKSSKRNASCIALTKVEAFMLDKQQYHDIVESELLDCLFKLI